MEYGMDMEWCLELSDIALQSGLLIIMTACRYNKLTWLIYDFEESSSTAILVTL